MKKVLINLLNVQSGGQFTYLLNLFAECENIKNYNFVFLINRIAENRLKDKKCNIPDNVKFQVVNSKYAYGMTSYFWQFINLPKIVSNVKPNYVYAPTHIAYKVSNITTVLSMRNMAIPNFNSIDISIKMKFSLFLKYLPTLWSLSKADKVIAVSNYVKDFLISIGKDKKNILVAYHPFDNLYRKDSSDVNTCRTLNRNDNIIFVPGSYYSYKKFHNILNYLNNIKLPRDTKIVFAGDEGDNKYVNRLESYDTMNFNTIFFRNLTVDEMKFLYKNSKIVILSSQVEACPNIAIESLASCSNILASDIPPFQEILGEFATYFHNDNKVSFVKSFNISINQKPDISIQKKQIDKICNIRLIDILYFIESD